MENQHNKSIDIQTPDEALGYGPYWDKVVAELADKIVAWSAQVVRNHYNGKPVVYSYSDHNLAKDNVRIRVMSQVQETLAKAGWYMTEIVYKERYYPSSSYRPTGPNKELVAMRIESIADHDKAQAARALNKEKWLVASMILASIIVILLAGILTAGGFNICEFTLLGVLLSYIVSTGLYIVYK